MLLQVFRAAVDWDGGAITQMPAPDILARVVGAISNKLAAG